MPTYEQFRDLVVLIGLPAVAVLFFIYGFARSGDRQWFMMANSHRAIVEDKDKQISQLQAWRTHDADRLQVAERRADRAERNVEKILPILERNTDLVETTAEAFPRLADAVQRVEVGIAKLGKAP